MDRFPHFIIIGAGKCGTTSLHDYLNQHPDIYICPKKETFFFIDDKARENSRKWGSVTTLQEYIDLFAEAPESAILGEISTNYYACPESAELIKRTIPDVKIIAILRDPSERAFSSYQMFIRNGHERRSFAEVITAKTQHITRGFYYQELLPFFQIFPAQQIKILLFDDLIKDQTKFLQDLFEFVGVRQDFLPDVSKRGREGGVPQNHWLHRLLTKKNLLRTSIASLLKLIFPLEKRQQLREKLLRHNIAKNKLDPALRAQLIDLYRDDIIQLQIMINRDLSAWLS